MNELHLFAGDGGGILAGVLLGHRCIGAVECSPHSQRVLKQRQADGALPDFPIFSDVRTFDGRPYRGRVDIVAGGFPCQAYSTATAGKNVADDLWPEMLRIVADVAPWYVFAENVSKRAIEAAANDCESLGFNTKCVSLGAKDLGADHVRERHWLLAYTDVHGELCRAEHAEVAERKVIRPSIWKAEPEQSRMADGLASAVDRLRATGNGQVPAVAAAAFQLLMQEAA